jgi:N-methylhydantoinase B/oxoprolinase/acetone carboxylase alpha subunit
MRDVRHGYVSPGSAERDYGVVCDPDTLNLNAGETEKRRAGR